MVLVLPLKSEKSKYSIWLKQSVLEARVLILIQLAVVTLIQPINTKRRYPCSVEILGYGIGS